jgi:asparagine synthase (glutamine-hydrolysing)
VHIEEMVQALRELGHEVCVVGWLQADVVRQLVTEHESGRHDHSTPLWSLLMFDAFLRNSVGEAKLAAAA